MKWTLLLLLLPLWGKGQINEYQGNTWLKELGKEVESKQLFDEAINGISIKLNTNSRVKHQHIWSKSGIYAEYGYAGSGRVRLKHIVFATKNAMKMLFEINDIPGFQDYRKGLPFGLYLNDSFREIDDITGRFPRKLIKQISPNHRRIKYSELPPFKGLDLTLHFIDEKLQAMELKIKPTRHEHYRAGLSTIWNLDFIPADDAIAEANKNYKKMPSGLTNTLLKSMLKKDDAKGYYSLKVASASDFEYSPITAGMEVVWKLDGLKYSSYLFESFRHELFASLQKNYLGGFFQKVLLADYDVKKLGDKNYVFFSPDDAENYQNKISKQLFHAYWDKEKRCVVLTGYRPQTFKKTKTFEPQLTEKELFSSAKSVGKIDEDSFDQAFELLKKIKSEEKGTASKNNSTKPSPKRSTQRNESNTTPSSSSKAATDEEISSNVPRLRKEMGLYPGNKHLAVVGDFTDDFSDMQGLKYLFKKHDGKLYVGNLNFWVGTQKKGYKGDIPYGLKRKMKLEEVLKKFPGAKWTSRSSDGYFKKINHIVKLTDEVWMNFNLLFRQDKLQNVMFEVNKPLSKEWQLLKKEIFE